MTKVIISEDKERVALIRQQLKDNQGYCPCRLIKTDETECICKEFREAIKAGKLGKCHCGLYEIISENNVEKAD